MTEEVLELALWLAAIPLTAALLMYVDNIVDTIESKRERK